MSRARGGETTHVRWTATNECLRGMDNDGNNDLRDTERYKK